MKYNAVINAVKEILAEYTSPLTLRQLFYRLVSKQLIPNTRSSYCQLSQQLVEAREQEHVDRGMLEDRGRQVLGEDDWGYENPEDFLECLTGGLKSQWENYQRPLWTDQPNKILLCVEKDSLSTIFTSVAEPYRIKVFPNKGYCSFSYVHKILTECDEEKTNIILYFGDYDPSGRDIQRSLEERLLKYAGFSPTNLILKRIALTEKQIQEYNLPPKPEDSATLAKLQRDPRARTYGIEYACELDAFNPAVLTRLIGEAIHSHLDSELWTSQFKLQEVEKQSAKELLRRITIVTGV